LGLCTACSRPVASDAPASQAAAPAPAVSPAPVAAMPADQANLLKLIADVDAHPKDGPTFDRFCAALEKTPDFTGWTGTVADAQISTVNGAIDITFSMGKHLKFEPVVQKADPVYPAVETLSVGQAVTLSGHFSHNKVSSECTYYLSGFAVSLTKVEPR
jgi:hypothetical protein